MKQTVTPALRQWIIEQASAGFAPDAVLEAMKSSGWDEDVAISAMESTLREHLQSQNKSATRASPPAADVPRTASPVVARPASGLPDVALSGAANQIDVGDGLVEVIASLINPRVLVLGHFLSDEECDGLIAAARPRMARSLTVETKSGGEELNPDRTSNGMFFTRGQTPLIERIEARIARLVNWPLENGEGLQVLHYRPGAEYKPHYDYFDPKEPGTPTIVKRGGQRVATLIMYLNEPTRGGATVFPDIGLEVAPLRGNAVFFSYDKPEPSTRSLHGGTPVLEGEKWVATKWLREGVFT